MSELPDLPDLFQARAIAGSDPFVDATEQAEAGCAAGLFSFDPTATDIKAALVLAPEVPLAGSMVMIPLCAVAFYDAASSLVGAEDDIKLDWNGGLRFGDELRGQVRLATPGDDIEAVPEWLVIGLNATFALRPDAAFPDPFEGVAPNYLLELWAKRIFDEISHWSDNGPKRLRNRWTKLSREKGQQVTLVGHQGRFNGVSDDFAAQLTVDKDTVQVPLSQLLVAAN